MDMNNPNTTMPPAVAAPMMPSGVAAPTQQTPQALPIGEEQLKEFMQTLQKYKTGKAQTEARILSTEQWWKLRNAEEAVREGATGEVKGHKSRSGWLHNVIVSKHADAIEAYPEPNILPREQDDKAEARLLSSIIPCVLEQNYFEQTYSDVAWQKLKTGTGVYKVIWDARKLNGLGDISIERVNLLNIYWEPGITDIQNSRYLFHTTLMDKDILKQEFPQLADKLKGTGFLSTKFLYDDTVDTSDKATVIEVYYHTNGVLHYCKFVDNEVLYATENDTQPVLDPMTGQQKPPMAQTGLYDHGKYPYVFDSLFPIEGSPCGYGFVDLCRNPQTEIDLLKTAFLRNAQAGAVPRYFSRLDGNINEEEFLDLNKTVVHVSGNVDEASIRRIEHNSLDGNYLGVLTQTVDELRQTSGNTETATGSAASGVTAASAIAALQEASGKGSRDATMSAYRAYGKIVELCIELIRQFYNLPRQFRIVGNYGAEQFISYSNQGLQPHTQDMFGQQVMRLPVFDVKISAQKKNVYTKVSQNELALQFFKMGFFNPQLTDQALMCLDMMDFDERDAIIQKVARNGTMFQKLQQYMQMALMLAQVADPQMAQGIYRDMVQTFGEQAAAGMGGEPQLVQADNVDGLKKEEHGIVRNARERSQNASQPEGGAVIREEKQ